MTECYVRNSHIYIYDFRTNLKYTYDIPFWESKWLPDPYISNDCTTVPDSYILLKTGGWPLAL